MADCESFYGNGESPLKILFVDLNDATYFNSIVHNIIHRELQQVEPFSKYLNLVNAYKLSLTLENIQEYCQGLDFPLSTVFTCDNTIIKENIRLQCPAIDPDNFIIIVIVDTVYDSLGGEIIYFGSNPALDKTSFMHISHNVGIHEIGHNFGLADLYFGAIHPDGSPTRYWSTDFTRAFYNVDGPGCSKWCDSYKPVSEYTDSITSECLNFTEKGDCVTFNRDEIGKCFEDDGYDPVCCVWSEDKFEYFDTNCVPAIGNENIGIDCLEGSGCYYGASYGNYAWRPVEDEDESIMYSLDAERFDPVSERHIENVLKCCYANDSDVTYCQQFRSEFNEFLRNYGFKKKLGICE